MIKIKMRRFASSISQGTFGELLIGDLVLYTVEKPWLDNAVRKSCIPEGTYSCKWVDSPKFGRTLEVENVYGRSHILFHVANVHSDLLGCIGLGTRLGALYGKWAVLQSKKATSKFLKTLQGEIDIQLEITNGNI